MGQTASPISSASQQLNQPATAIADPNGNATFTFPNPPTGLTWSGTLLCTSAPIASTFIAMVGAVEWATWGGPSIGGPVQCQSTQQLVVTATGLTPGTTYQLNWTGSSDEQSQAPAIWPEPNASNLTAQTVVPPPTVVLGPGQIPIVAGHGTSSVFLVNGTVRTLLVTCKPSSGNSNHVTSLFLTGQTTGNFYGGGPYLATGGQTVLMVVPIPPSLEPAGYTVTIGSSDPTVTVTVVADTASYDESLYYDGHLLSASVGGAGTLLNGPARIFSLSLESPAAPENLSINGTPIIVAESGTIVVMSFPTPVILGPGGQVTITGGNGGAVYAYP